LSLEGHLSQLAVATSNQRYIAENAGYLVLTNAWPSLCLHLQQRTLSNDVVILSR
jgi:hypothetical protein